MKYYYPYISDRPEKKYYIITNDDKKFILVRLPRLILQFIKMKKGNKDIFYVIKKENFNVGIIQIMQAIGP